jgi:energy-coupling factor transporter ATP-binding protein EcfA2
MAELPTIKSIHFTGVFGHQELRAEFKPGLNLLHGKNGSGKTTLLHILANLFGGDLVRFCSIQFQQLIFIFSDETNVTLEQAGEKEGYVKVSNSGKALGDLSRDTPVPPEIADMMAKLFPKRPVYLPAFRSILEAASDRDEYGVIYRDSTEFRSEFAAVRAAEERFLKERKENVFGPRRDPANATASKTVLSRHWFGKFVPIIRYPSLADVSRHLAAEFEQAYFAINRTNQATFTTVFAEVLRAVQEQGEPTSTEEISTLLSRVQSQLHALTPDQASGTKGDGDKAKEIQAPRAWNKEEKSIKRILEIYDTALTSRAQKEAEAYSKLRLFEDSFNRFVAPKSLRVIPIDGRTRRGPRIQLTDKHSETLDVLSSGERQVLTMLFCATHMSPADGTMLIDEPEISLHIDWQRIIVSEIMAQAGDRQIIVCTHAPEVVSEHRDALVELDSSTWSHASNDTANDDVDSDVSEGE